jgi:Protein of unknown function (DUF2971)
MTPDDWKQKLLKLMINAPPKRHAGRRLATALRQVRQHFPASIYKFYSFKGHGVENFAKGQIWLDHPKSVNDPFDCSFIVEAEALAANLSKGLISTINEPLVENITESIREHMVFCSFTEVKNSPLMWGHYANNQNGFALEWKLESFVSDYFSQSLFPIIYQNKLPNLTEKACVLLLEEGPSYDPGFFAAAMVKAKEWQYEKEWRIIKMDLHEKAGRAQKIPNPAALYLGREIEPREKECILSIAHNKRIPCYQAYPDKGSFTIQFTSLKIPHEIEETKLRKGECMPSTLTDEEKQRLSLLIDKYIKRRVNRDGCLDGNASYVVAHINSEKFEDIHVLWQAYVVVSFLLEFSPWQRGLFDDSDLSFLKEIHESIRAAVDAN